MEVKELITKYPQGGERTLIYATTGREINSSQLPADVGCVVDNVDTVIEIYKAVLLGRPVMNRIVTVTGDAVAEPKNFSVLAGTNMEELVEAAGGLKEKTAKVVSGGPMMGFAMYDLHVPCIKTTSAFCVWRGIPYLKKHSRQPASTAAAVSVSVPDMYFLHVWLPLPSMAIWTASRNSMVWNAVNAAAAVISARQRGH